MSQPFDVERVLAQLTLEEKAALTSGTDFWRTEPVERLGVPAAMVADGPHGLRKQALDEAFTGSEPATCFPTAAALGSTWDPDLLRRVGEALGRETRAADVQVLLGPGVNIKRTPLCGRNFEYVSEDPVLAGDLAAALVEGIQSQGVGTSLKHFAANNQETDRMRTSAEVDERTLREIYLPAFERVVRRAQPWTVMCAYNKLNGVYGSENRWLLTEVLRDEWGFDGLVVSDWGAVHDRVAALEAGLDLMMPSVGSRPDDEVVAAVRDGSLDEAVLDQAARRVLRLVERGLAGADPGTSFDPEAHHALAREAAAAAAVLLKNDDVDGTPALPLTGPDVLVVGEFAREPRYQGAGSSRVNPTRLDDALTALRDALGAPLPFEPGFTIAGGPAGDDDALLASAVEAARTAGTVVAFLGLPGPDESEGFDRSTLDLPANQVALLHALAEVTDRVVVVLANGSAVTLSEWRDDVAAILEGWLGGQATGSAVADLLVGAVAPSGRLAETIPHRLQDTPAYGSFPGELHRVRYSEGVLVGYRWYDTRDVGVAYPFGHGLTYTTFAWSYPSVVVHGEGEATTVDVHVTVTNTGGRAGVEVVQVYVGDDEAAVLRPRRELKAFERVVLEPGESREVALRLTARDLSYWHVGRHAWVLEPGRFTVEVAASSRDVRAALGIAVAGPLVVEPLSSWSSLHDWVDHPDGEPLIRATFADAGLAAPDGHELEWAYEIPLRVLAEWNAVPFDRAGLQALLDRLPAA